VSTPAPHLYPDALGDDAPMAGPEQLAERGVPTRAPKTWVPKRVLITPSARQWPLATRTAERAAALGAEIVELTADRITGLTGETDRETYAKACSRSRPAPTGASTSPRGAPRTASTATSPGRCPARR